MPNYGKVVFSKAEIQKRVSELGERISKDYKGEDLLLVGVMKGAFMFMADLSRAISIPVSIDYIGISAFHSRSKGRGAVRLSSDLNENITGKNVLIVEDIINSGLTMEYIVNNLKVREPKSVKVCTLLDKTDKRRNEFHPDYVGFTIPNIYVIGYGLDHQDRYRNLSYISALDENT
ncbi:MAG: hypoxanthine phosphoribosyltransferase [Nitrospirota bacterium]